MVTLSNITIWTVATKHWTIDNSDLLIKAIKRNKIQQVSYNNSKYKNLIRNNNILNTLIYLAVGMLS